MSYNADDTLAKWVLDYQKLLQRISELAQKIAPDYPNIASVDPGEQLYAIETSFEGTELALGDWEDFAGLLGLRAYGSDWGREKATEVWDEMMKKKREAEK